MAENVIVLGLTGPTGAGKSTVAAAFQKLGCAVIDCDVLAGEVLKLEECQKQLQQAFGEDVVTSRTVNRRLLAERAFQNAESAALLNSITHPMIVKEIQQEIQRHKEEGASFILMDAALLFESGADALCTATVAVTAKLSTRIKRITARDGIDEAHAKARIAAQQPDEYYHSRATYDVNGNVALSRITKQVQKLHKTILDRFG